MGSNERRQRARLEVRTRILDAARDLFAAEGLETVTMRRIAERIEYTPTTIYQHFADKNALLEALCAEDFLAFAEQFQVVLQLPDPIERIDAMARAYLRFAMTHPIHYRLLFMTPLPPASAPDDSNRGVPERDAYAALQWVMAEAIASGRLRPEHSELHLACQTAWSCIHGVASLAIAMRGRKEWFEWRPLEAIFDNVNAFVMRGLVKQGDAYFATQRTSVALPQPPASRTSKKGKKP
jgi:AcrR family transcriptional regulator